MGAILQEIKDKIKAYLADQNLFISLVLVFVALGAFGLGRQSVETTSIAPEAKRVEAEAKEPHTATAAETSLQSTHYVASKNGQVYHLPHCSGAKNIAAANKITFASKAEAEAAGYRPAANCKGI